MKRFLWLGFVLLLYLICTGCGDTFRPIIIPNPPTFPNPAAAHSVVAISDNGTTVAGSVMVIDVSGDSITSVADCTTPLCIGIAPVHAVQQTAGQALVVNQSDSLSKVSFSNITSINTTTTITLPVGSAPNFVAVAPNQTTAYVTLPNYVPSLGRRGQHLEQRLDEHDRGRKQSVRPGRHSRQHQALRGELGQRHELLDQCLQHRGPLDAHH